MAKKILNVNSSAAKDLNAFANVGWSEQGRSSRRAGS